jgi:hypothetical protein
MAGLAKGWQAVGQLLGWLEQSKFVAGGELVVNLKFFQ